MLSRLASVKHFLGEPDRVSDLGEPKCEARALYSMGLQVPSSCPRLRALMPRFLHRSGPHGCKTYLRGMKGQPEETPLPSAFGQEPKQIKPESALNFL